MGRGCDRLEPKLVTYLSLDRWAGVTLSSTLVRLTPSHSTSASGADHKESGVAQLPMSARQEQKRVIVVDGSSSHVASLLGRYLEDDWSVECHEDLIDAIGVVDLGSTDLLAIDAGNRAGRQHLATLSGLAPHLLCRTVVFNLGDSMTGRGRLAADIEPPVAPWALVREFQACHDRLSILHPHAHNTAQPSLHLERRQESRLALDIPVRARLGAGDAWLVDISVNGARVIHERPAEPASARQFEVLLDEEPFEATVEIVSSHPSLLGTGPDGAAAFESRLKYVEVTPAAREMLSRYVQNVLRRRDHIRICNAHGIGTEPISPLIAPQRFLRLERSADGWRRELTSDPTPPPDGLTIAPTLADFEIDMLCRIYDEADAETRGMMQAIAAATARP